MRKVYSRTRIQVPKIFASGRTSSPISFIKKEETKNIKNKMSTINMNKIYKQNGKVNKIATILLILIIAFSIVKISLDAVDPIFRTLCENKAKEIATIASNEQATNVMQNYSYDDLFSIEKDAEGNITLIKSNMITMNQIASEVPVKIQNKINNQGKENISIALGSFTGIKFLVGRGPGINIKITSIGNVETNLKSEFVAKGINQTAHRVYLNVVCNVSILTPFENTEKQIVNQVLLMENVIVGKIPETYYNLEGIREDDVMEVMQ